MPEMNQRTTHDELNQLIAWQVEQARNATVMAERYKLALEQAQTALTAAKAEIERLKALLPQGEPA